MSDSMPPRPKAGTFEFHKIYSSVPEEDQVPPLDSSLLRSLIHPGRRLTTRAVRFMLLHAQMAVLDLHHAALGTEHLLLGFLRYQHHEDLTPLWTALGQRPAQLHQDFANELVAGDAAKPEEVISTPACERAVRAAQEEAGDQQMTAIHLLLGLCRENSGQAATFLHQRGITYHQVRAFLHQEGPR